MPWFVNWNDYRSSFEAQAGKILGQPVHVLGTADAKILPTPSLTFTNVQVGAADGKPMMTVERFAVTIELMPLLQGQIKVVSMQLVRPHLNIVADEKGAVDWFHRGPASRELDPDKVALQDVEINDGSVSYVDPHIGGALTFNHVNAVVEARALSGPWRIDGSYLDGATQVPFRVATGRVLDDGTIRVKTDISPAQWPVAVAADGVVGIGDEGLSYTGTFNLTQIVPAVDDGKNGGDNAGWRTEGSFKLTSDKLVVDKGVLSIGPPDRSYSLAGSATFDLGKKPSFEASLQARQLDLDRTLGKGPSAPIEVPKAVDELVAWIRSTALPSIPGRIDFQVPAIVVGGSIIQDVSFAAVTADKGWHIAGLNAQLPGQTVVAADGTLTTGGAIGFDGKVRLTVGQPATFAAWWRGRSEQGGGRLVAPFSVFGNAQIGAGRLSLDNMDATIGGASIVGNVSWSADKGAAGGHHLTTDLKADKIDFAQIRAIAELLAGRDPTALIVNSGGASSADSYAIKLSAGEMTIEDITLRGVAVDASLADQALVVNQFAIADLGGARLTVSKGRIDSLSDKPSGRLDARLTAKSLTGLSRIVDSIAPDSALSRWLTRAAPSLAGADITASLAAPAERAGADFAIKVDGTAGDTTLDAALSLSGKLADWRKGKADLQVTIDTPNSVVLARQAGFTVEPSAETKAAHIDLSGAGVPAEGMTAKLGGVFAGVSVDTAGTLTLPATGPATYAGTFAAAAEMLDPLMKMADIGIPGAAVGTALGLNGRIAVTGRTVDLNWQNGQVGDRQVGGGLKLTYGEDGAWAIGGDLSVDSVDLGWLASLGLGFAPVPTGDAAVPWSKAPFGEPTFSHVHGQIGVTTSELTDRGRLRRRQCRLRHRPRAGAGRFQSAGRHGGRRDLRRRLLDSQCRRQRQCHGPSQPQGRFAGIADLAPGRASGGDRRA